MPTPKSPYDHIPESDRVRIQAMVPLEAKLFIQSIFPERGILLFLTESFIHAIVHDLKHAGINSYSPDNADKLLGFVRERTNPEFGKHRLVEVKPSGVAGLCSTCPHAASLTPVVHEGAPRRVRRGGSSKPNARKSVKAKKGKSAE